MKTTWEVLTHEARSWVVVENLFVLHGQEGWEPMQVLPKDSGVLGGQTWIVLFKRSKREASPHCAMGAACTFPCICSCERCAQARADEAELRSR